MTQNINALKKRYPFPKNKPELTKFYWSLDGGGREIIKEIIIEQGISLMLEIGVFFGGSAQQWLDTSEQLTLVGVDPFPKLSGYFAKSYDRYQKNIILGDHSYESLLEQLQLENGTYLSVINNLWDYRDRFIPIPKKSPDILYELNYYQIAPQLIYLDGDHQLNELPIIDRIFPNAIVTGNSWTWKQGDRLPVQEKVTAFARQHDYQIVTKKGSWVLQKRGEKLASSVSKSAVGSEIAAAMDTSVTESKQIRLRNGLGNLEQKLKQQVCKIAYLGGSVTAQKRGYRPHLHQWFQEHYQQPHILVNGAIGGVISGAAVFIMDETVIKEKPDICFIEYITIDVAWNSPEISYAVEGMVRKLKAIGCQVCFLYLYRRDRQFDSLNSIIEMYEEIAEFYGLPAIDVAEYIESNFKEDKITIEKLFKDYVHNTTQGGDFVATYIAKSLNKILLESLKLPVPQMTYQDCLYSDIYATVKVVAVDESMITGSRKYQVGCFEDLLLEKKYQYYQIDAFSQFEFIIKGRLMAIMTVIGRESGIAELITPEHRWEYSFWDSQCHYDRLHARPICRSFNDYTPVTLKLTNQSPDYSTCRREIENPAAIVKDLKIIGLLVCGEVLSLNHQNQKYSDEASRVLQ